jgi:hypothetical protein
MWIYFLNLIYIFYSLLISIAISYSLLISTVLIIPDKLQLNNSPFYNQDL